MSRRVTRPAFIPLTREQYDRIVADAIEPWADDVAAVVVPVDALERAREAGASGMQDLTDAIQRAQTSDAAKARLGTHKFPRTWEWVVERVKAEPRISLRDLEEKFPEDGLRLYRKDGRLYEDGVVYRRDNQRKKVHRGDLVPIGRGTLARYLTEAKKILR